MATLAEHIAARNDADLLARFVAAAEVTGIDNPQGWLSSTAANSSPPGSTTTTLSPTCTLTPSPRTSRRPAPALTLPPSPTTRSGRPSRRCRKSGRWNDPLGARPRRRPRPGGQ